MAFGDDIVQEVPARVSAVSITLIKQISRNEDGADGAVRYAATFVVRREDAAGVEITPVQGELLKHLTNADKAMLQDFINRMHVKATAETLNV